MPSYDRIGIITVVIEGIIVIDGHKVARKHIARENRILHYDLDVIALENFRHIVIQEKRVCYNYTNIFVGINKYLCIANVICKN